MFIGVVQELVDNASALLLLDPSLLRFLLFSKKLVIHFPALMSSIRDGAAPDRRSDDIRQLSIGTATRTHYHVWVRLRRPTTQADTLNAEPARLPEGVTQAKKYRPAQTRHLNFGTKLTYPPKAAMSGFRCEADVSL